MSTNLHRTDTKEEPMKQEKTPEVEPVLSDRRRDFVAKRLIRLIDECAGYGGNLDEMAHAAADATRALIELERA
jgi:hypothetical protein